MDMVLIWNNNVNIIRKEWKMDGQMINIKKVLIINKLIIHLLKMKRKIT